MAVPSKFFKFHHCSLLILRIPQNSNNCRLVVQVVNVRQITFDNASPGKQNIERSDCCEEFRRNYLAYLNILAVLFYY